ncbi:MAG: hypothetical protein NVSMB59_22720 [Vulcanimicrobiaceae bacterium]
MKQHVAVQAMLDSGLTGEFLLAAHERLKMGQSYRWSMAGLQKAIQADHTPAAARATVTNDRSLSYLERLNGVRPEEQRA